jgi:hypothetical protein
VEGKNLAIERRFVGSVGDQLAAAAAELAAWVRALRGSGLMLAGRGRDADEHRGSEEKIAPPHFAPPPVDCALGG